MRQSLLALIAFTALISSPAWAYYTVLDNGEIMGAGKYKLSPGLDFLTDKGGVNLNTSADIGINDEFGARANIGFGEVNFYGGGFIKWQPIPDIDKQPAVALNAGLVYAADGNFTELTVRFEPIMSKKFVVGDNAFTPYVSLPIGLRNRDWDNRSDENDVAWQAVLGSQMQLEAWKNLQFIAEIGFNIDNAPSHFAISAVMYFDKDNGFSLQ
jgi:hypothetical protein